VNLGVRTVMEKPSLSTHLNLLKNYEKSPRNTAKLRTMMHIQSLLCLLYIRTRCTPDAVYGFTLSRMSSCPSRGKTSICSDTILPWYTQRQSPTVCLCLSL